MRELEQELSSWAAHTTERNRRSLLHSLRRDEFVVDDAIPEYVLSDGTRVSKVYVIRIKSHYLPVFKPALQPVRSELYKMIRREMGVT